MTPVLKKRFARTSDVAGFRCRCPHCGTGELFGRFLKVADHCQECGEEFHHHRADDFPAYLVIIVVGHVIVPAILAVETRLFAAHWLHSLSGFR